MDTICVLSGTADIFPDEQKANAERIVNCINHCAGIVDTSVIPELINLCEIITSEAFLDNDVSFFIERIQALLTKSNGE